MKRLITIFSIFLLFHSTQANADDVTLSFATNPPGGGTVTGGGTAPSGSSFRVIISAANGWYIQDATLNPNSQYLTIEKLILLAQVPTSQGSTDATTYTNDDEFITLTGDSLLTVTFAPLSPTIISQPASQAAIIGDSVTLSSVASGRRAIAYQWKKDGQNLLGVQGTNLVMNNVQFTNSGIYSVTASNAFGITTSQDAILTVTNFLLFADSQPVLTPAFVANDYDLFSLRSIYSPGSIFYTLDGSLPDFTSTLYDGTFTIHDSCTLRAIACSADFSQSILLNPVALTIIRNYDLWAYSGGGGAIMINPLTNHFPVNTVVTVAAIPDPGSIFMNWSGAISGNALTNTITMDSPKQVQATFGTTLGSTVAGNGVVSVSPSVPVYPFGSTVTFSAVPNPGNYFVRWGNAISDTQNPLYYTVNTATQSVSALFATLPASLVSLTVVPQGGGTVSISPSTNRFLVGANVTLIANSDGNQHFIGWSGDASGTANPLSVIMTASKVITVNFTRKASLSIQPDRTNAAISLTGVPGQIYQIETSTNLSTWLPFCTVTNFFDSSIFSDPIWQSVPLRMYRVAAP